MDLVVCGWRIRDDDGDDHHFDTSGEARGAAGLHAAAGRVLRTRQGDPVRLSGPGEARWDSDADILVVMPFQGRHLAKIREMRRRCQVQFPLDLLVRRPEEIEVRYRGGDPLVREAMDHGELLHG